MAGRTGHTGGGTGRSGDTGGGAAVARNTGGGGAVCVLALALRLDEARHHLPLERLRLWKALEGMLEAARVRS